MALFLLAKLDNAWQLMANLWPTQCHRGPKWSHLDQICPKNYNSYLLYPNAQIQKIYPVLNAIANRDHVPTLDPSMTNFVQT